MAFKDKEKEKEYRNRYYQENRENILEKARLRRQNNPEYMREYKKKNKKQLAKYMQVYSAKRNYGLTEEEYLSRFIEQDGYCAICGIHQTWCKRTLSIDHNHKTKEVRGLLCNRCNLLLGHARDNIQILEYAIKYLHKYATKS